MANYLLKTFIHRLNIVRPPAYGQKFRGPVLVLGSAPTANLPVGFDDSFTVITVNGAQYHLQHWKVREPDVTFLTYSQVKDQTPKAEGVRRVLAGHRTGSLYLVRWHRPRRELVAALASMSYGYDVLHRVGRLQRMALYRRVTGKDNLEKDIDTRYSNGITAVLFALYNGAREVIISGIDPDSSGHANDTANKIRQHVEIDKEVIEDLLRRGTRLYTSDPGVAERSGIPLWTGLRP